MQKQPFVIKIIYKGGDFDFFENSIPFKQQVLLYGDYCFKKYGKVKSNKMNGFISGNYERYYIRNKKDLVNKLYSTNKKRIFLGKAVTKIDLKNHEIMFQNNGAISYDSLISTIPIDVFNKISGTDIKIDQLKLNLICCIVKNHNHKFFENNFVYVPDTNYTFHRINVCKSRKMLVFELCDDARCSFDVFSFLGSRGLKIQKIDGTSFTFPFVTDDIAIDGVKFLGRFATGDYEVKIDNVIKEMETASGHAETDI
jgi:hypothetical protein